MRTQRQMVAGAVAVVALVVAGCSSSGESNGGATATVGGRSTAPGKPIPVGVIGGYSSAVASSIAGAKDSIQAWADSVNANGGINGRPVKLYIEDDGGNVATSLTKVKSLVEKDHVVAIVGQASGNAAPWESYIEKAGIPVVGGNTSEHAYLSNPDFFAVGGNILANFYGVAVTARANGTKLGNLYCAELPACESTVTLLKTYGKDLGVDLSYSSKVSASAPDFTAPCQGLKSAAVESYTLGLAAATLRQVADACTQQGLGAKLILSNVADSNFAANKAFDGLQVVDAMFPFFDTSTPATRAFHDAIAKYAPALGTEKSPLNSQVTQAYASGKLFEAAVKASGEDAVTPESVKKGLYALKDETLGGLTVPLTYTEGKPTAHNCYFTYTISDGKFVAPNGLKTSCAPDAAIADVLAKLSHK